MRLGMTLPVMEPDLWEQPDTLERWARAIDAGPYASLCFGERMAFDNPETMTLLGAVSAWTTRVRLVTTVVVPQLHRPLPLAKALATADRLSHGRLTAGLGIGGRVEDYRAAQSDYDQTYGELARLATALQDVWRGANPTGAARPVGPSPLQDGGPPLLVGVAESRAGDAAVLAPADLGQAVEAVEQARAVDPGRGAAAPAARDSRGVAHRYHLS